MGTKKLALEDKILIRQNTKPFLWALLFIFLFLQIFQNSCQSIAEYRHTQIRIMDLLLPYLLKCQLFLSKASKTTTSIYMKSSVGYECLHMDVH